MERQNDLLCFSLNVHGSHTQMFFQLPGWRAPAISFFFTYALTSLPEHQFYLVPKFNEGGVPCIV